MDQKNVNITSRELNMFQAKAENLLDVILSMRENVCHLRLELELIYRPVLEGTHPLSQEHQYQNQEKTDILCPVYSKCNEKVRAIHSFLAQLPSEFEND